MQEIGSKKIDGNHFALCDGIHQYDHACDIYSTPKKYFLLFWQGLIDISISNQKSNIFLARISPHTPQMHYRSIDLPIHTDIFSSHDIPAYTGNTDPASPDAGHSLPLEFQKSTHGNCDR